MENYVLTNTSPRTAEGYRVIIQRHLIPNLGIIPLTQLQPSHIQCYYAKALSEGRAGNNGKLSARTVRNIHKVLSEALSHAVKWQILVRNVALAVDPPRPSQSEMATFTEEQAKLFLEAVAESRYHELFTVAFYTGMRRSELLGLPPMVCILLRQLKERQIGERLLLGLRLQEDDLVFSKPDGKLLDPSTITHTFKKILKRAGLPTLRFHDLRHTHASLMLKQGIHPKIVSERLGHSNIGITLDTYSHVMPGLQEAAALRFEEGLQHIAEQPAEEMLANG